jgi:hypothetical protein
MPKIPVPTVPHSWRLDDWPAGVYPGAASKGRYVVRANRTALIAIGALVRVGRDLVVMGAAYSSWISKQGERVRDYQIAPNRQRAGAGPARGEPTR